MRTYNPKYKDDAAEAAKLNALPWQLDLLKLNPSYVHWGNGEDYMAKSGDAGWDRPVIVPTWGENGFQGLDDYNECVHFYFTVQRSNYTCPFCDGEGVNPATKRIANDFYDFDNTGARWADKITQDEVVALIKNGRLSNLAKPTTSLDGKQTTTNYYYDEEKGKWYGWFRIEGEPMKGKKRQVKPPTEFPTAEEVNALQNKKGAGFHSHDAINRWILIDTRARRLGVYGKCTQCGGDGYIFDEPEAKVGLQLWVLHPRKGAARGVYVENITEADLPSVFKYLGEAAKRNAKRFSKIPWITKEGKIYTQRFNHIF